MNSLHSAGKNHKPRRTLSYTKENLGKSKLCTVWALADQCRALQLAWVFPSCTFVSFVVNALRNFLDDPIILSKSSDDNPTEMRACRSGHSKQHDWKRVFIPPDSLPMFDFIRGLRPRRKETLQDLGRSLLAGCVSQHHDSGLVVLNLPRVEKAISSGKRRTVCGINGTGAALRHSSKRAGA